MNLSRLASSQLHSKPGRHLVAFTTRLFYLDPARRYLIHTASRLLVTSKLIPNDPPGWQKIYAQYRWISLAVLSSIDRAIEKRVLAPQVAGRIFELWGCALLPLRQRRLIIQRFSKEHGAAPPWFLVISPTRACNLACTGCYANAGSGTGNPQPATLPWDILDRIVREAKEQWGICLFVFSGGEPLAYRSQGKDLLDLVARHDDCLFLIFTNGTLITSETARRLARLGNLTPALSVEGLGEATTSTGGRGLRKGTSGNVGVEGGRSPVRDFHDRDAGELRTDPFRPAARLLLRGAGRVLRLYISIYAHWQVPQPGLEGFLW